MYKEADKQTWLKYWHAEQSFPQWFKSANDVWTMTEDEFIGFCEQCWKIYELDNTALIYVEKIGEHANIHCSILRDADVDVLVASLVDVRIELLKQFKMVFGFVVRQNKGLRRICEKMGMKQNGVKMLHGEFHGKVIEWLCYVIFPIENRRSLLSLT